MTYAVSMGPGTKRAGQYPREIMIPRHVESFHNEEKTTGRSLSTVPLQSQDRHHLLQHSKYPKKGYFQ